MAGVIRLQQTYKLPTAELSQGNIFGHYARDKLDGDDFYKFGASAILSSDTGNDAPLLLMFSSHAGLKDSRRNSSLPRVRPD